MKLRATQKQIDKWTKALESGKFKQGRNALQLDDAYCCLGVFCKVNNIPYVALGKSDLSALGINDSFKNEEAYTHLGKVLGTGTTELAGMNDGGATFKEIAEVIKSWRIAD